MNIIRSLILTCFLLSNLQAHMQEFIQACDDITMQVNYEKAQILTIEA